MLKITRHIKTAAATTVLLFTSATLMAQQNIAGGSDTVTVRLPGVNAGVVVSGVITDNATKKAISGISVQVKGFSANITDDKGRFTLKAPSYNSLLSISGEGYAAMQVPLNGMTSIAVSLLDESHESFNDKVMMPFELTAGKDLTVSAGQFKVNSGWNLQPGETADALMQGRIAGLNVIRRSGTPGVGANMFLRGFNSLYGTNKPLIIVDNMLFDANDYGESIIANNYTNPLALIDAKDIANITVLRDASSIYGTKGGNGAIIVTTSRAPQQATRIDFGTYAGFNFAPKNLPVMNVADYRTYLSEMLQSKGMTSTQISALPYMNDDPANPDYARYHANTDWQDKVLKNSMNQNYYLKVTGGDNIATYALSMGVLKNEGIVKATDLTRYNTRFNAVFNFSKKLTGMANLAFTYNEQNLKDQGIADKTNPIFLALVKAPFLPENEVNDEGVASPNLSDRDTLGIGNPSAIINQMQAYNKYYRFYGSFGFNYEISKHLSASTMFGVVYDKVRENIFVPGKGVAKDTLPNAIANNRLGTQVKRLFTLYNDTKLEYKRNIGNSHNLASRLGVRYQHNAAEQDYALGYNSATDDLVSVQNGLNALRQVGGDVGNWNWINTYFNIDYGFRNKWFLSLNAAMDGHSRFGIKADNAVTIGGFPFAVMPSVSAAWLLSSESFMAGTPIDLLKLRATYGIAGNDDIGNYTSRQTYVSQNLLGMQGLVRSGIANPALRWETSKKINIGADLAFWNERVNLAADFYRTHTSNMLVYQPLQTSTGFASMLSNAGSMRNTGFDASMNIRIINNRSLKWDMGINVGTFRNEILQVPGNQFFTEFAGATLITAIHQPASQFFGYTTNGIFVTDAAAATSGLKKKNADGSFRSFTGGDVHFNDLNGDKIIDENDRSVIGNANPAMVGGFTNRLSWKRFELNALLTFSQGNDVFNYTRFRLESMKGIENQLVSVNNRWRTNGQVATMPKATYGDPMGNSRFSDRWMEDGSYLRLRNVSLEYHIPIKTGAVKNATVYVLGNNLFTLTNYLGFDPEFSASPSVFAQGIDTGLDPQFKSVTMGVRIGL